MLLSIVMMIKNEEKYLEKTLDALEPLRNRLENELIILDTGSTDKSVDIARKYTDKIYFYKWNDNFAHMRNKSIEFARGNWILILDADEELIEFDKLIKFFNSKLCEKYNSASIELKNMHSYEGKDYSKSSILRLFRNGDSFRYEGAIHEQPIYKTPIYNNILVCNHYGYVYIDEEVKQKKLERNERILFSELKKNENNPYMNYQLAKNYMAYMKLEDALIYMKKSYELYQLLGQVPIRIQSDLANLYNMMNRDIECEDICNEYIIDDDKNIDIYYYLAKSQHRQGKYNESLNNYKKYIYLIENYKLSTQANSIFCDGVTAGLKDFAIIEIIKIYFKLSKYEEVLREAYLINSQLICQVYDIVIVSLCKKNKYEEILRLYYEINNSTVQKNKFKTLLERELIFLTDNEKQKLYKVFSKIEENYGILNKVRLGLVITDEESREILLEEKESYYGDILYYAFNNGNDILDILNGISYTCTQNYMDYIVNNRRDCILNLYNYILKSACTIELNKLKIYSCISKSLLFRGNLANEKYNNTFLMYIASRYDLIKQLYNENLSDEKILSFVKDEEDMFVINVNLLQQLKRVDKLTYIKDIKKLLIDNPMYKNGIQIFITKFTSEYEEGEELKSFKVNCKNTIEKNINLGKVSDAINMINEYEEMFNDDKLYNMKAIVNLYQNNIEESERLLKLSYINNKLDENTIFNIAYMKELKKEYKEAIWFYNKSSELSSDKDYKIEILNKVNYLERLI